ncbi:glycosyltransferase family 2 protein [Gordonia sp. OPL2]|uniref:glycosyltransferase family 2 protein n=1 Tax=Gordonia sp. OPL2 TaxID=2486274 RepID=UPI0021CD0648|nr:glycosyltransferase family 2 protein [Gordonia sp. OPL2]
MVIPVFRSADYIAACVESVAAQHRPVHEVVLVDDCGGDDSIAIAEAVLTSCGVASTVVRLPANRGIGGARNAGMSAVSGDLVWFLDSDDLAHPAFTATMVEAMITHDADFVACGTEFIDEDETPLGAVDVGPSEPAIAGPRFAQLLVDGKVKAYAGARLFRREVLSDAPWDARRAYEDMAATARMSLRANVVAIVGSPLLRYRQRPSSVSNSVSPNSVALFEMGEDMAGLIDRIAEPARRRPVARNFAYREVLIPAAHIAMRADHAGLGDDPVVAALMTGARRRSSLSDVVPLLADRQFRSAVFAAGIVLTPNLYSRILRRRPDRV